MDLTKEQLEAEVERLGPFHHGIELPHGVNTQVAERARGKGELNRIRDLEVGAWPAILDVFDGSLAGRAVLDVGCNSGGFSVKAARDGATRVLGIDTVDRYVEQGRFIKEALELPALEFRTLAIEEVEEGTTGSFDLTLCFGVLFHLENPVLALRRLGAVTQRALVVDTNINRSERSTWQMRIVGAPNPDNPSTSLWRAPEGAVQFMPSAVALEELLRFLGFSQVSRLPPHKDQARRYHKGTRATFVAVR